jgi:hypothetical protein
MSNGPKTLIVELTIDEWRAIKEILLEACAEAEEADDPLTEVEEVIDRVQEGVERWEGGHPKRGELH